MRAMGAVHGPSTRTPPRVLVLDEILAQDRRPPRRFFQLLRLHQHIGQHAERRVVHPAAVLQLALGKGRVVVRGGGEDRVVIGIIGLHHHAARQFAAAGAAR